MTACIQGEDLRVAVTFHAVLHAAAGGWPAGSLPEERPWYRLGGRARVFSLHHMLFPFIASGKETMPVLLFTVHGARHGICVEETVQFSV